MKKTIWSIAIVALAMVVALGGRARADDDHDGDHDQDKNTHFEFKAGTIVLSRSVYTGTATPLVAGTTVLPPGCQTVTVILPLLTADSGVANTTIPVACVNAADNSEYPTLVGGVWDGHNVFNNAPVDGSFGVTSPIFLDNLSDDGKLLGTLAIPPSMIVTSFSSKSELALNRALDGKSITFVAYHGGPGCPALVAAPAPNSEDFDYPAGALPGPMSPTGAGLLDVSNANTPGVCDPTNPVVSSGGATPTAYYRSVAEVDADGHIKITDGNAYSGNNGRASFKAYGTYYMTGNDNNGGLAAKGELPKTGCVVSTVCPDGLTNTQIGHNLISSTGAELLVPGQPAPVPPGINMIGDFEITAAGYAAPDKAGKDNNFRGLTIFNGTMYVTKGSGGNGIDTVYQVGNPGVLPAGNTAMLESTPIKVLPGFPTALATNADVTYDYPFGIWFANDHTLYVGDEGDGKIADAASPKSQAGLQKWNWVGGTWKLDYILTNGLALGVQYGVANYPASLNPATDGIRNITGRVNHDGTVTVWGVTSTVSTNGDQGADPNELVSVTDVLDATTLPTDTDVDKHPDKDDSFETFKVLQTAKAGEVFRGVTLAPEDNDADDHDHDNGHDNDRDNDHDKR